MCLMRLMLLTNSKKQLKNKNKKNTNTGQVSIEALLLWAALAGTLALFALVFAQTMDAYTVLARTAQFTLFADELQSNVDWISFAAPGSQIRMRVPALKEMNITVNPNEIELLFDDESLSHAKKRIITSAVEIAGDFSPGETITLLRAEGKITIQ
jgi:hypothetical protein